MTLGHLKYCKKLLELTVFLMGIVATSSLEQCGPETILVFRNVGVKLCQLKCIEHGQCLSFEYDTKTLTCRLTRYDSKQTKKKEGHTNLSRKSSDVFSGSCAAKTCIVGQRCLKTRSGNAVCVQDGKQTYTEASPQHDDDKQGSFATSPLHDACRKGNLVQVRQILARGSIDIDIRDKRYGRTPLMVAAKKGHSQVFEFLLRKGANVSCVDNIGDNVLYMACSRGHVDIVRHVLSLHSVDIDSRGRYSRTPLMVAILQGHREVVDVLVEMGANVSLVDDDGDNILHSACRGGLVDMVRYVVSQHSVDVNSRSKSGKTSLMTTVYYGYRELFDVLVDMGANISQVEDDGDNVLHWACRGGHVVTVKHLISNYNVDINSRGMYGRTPLMTTVYYGYIVICKYLVGLGAIVSDVDDHGDNILHLASKRGHSKMILHIISQDMVDINSRGRYGRTPLMTAAHHGKTEAFDVLVSSGCRSDLVDDEGHTILHLACLHARIDMAVRIISQNMSDINARDEAGKTAAIMAKHGGQRYCFKCLS